MRVKRGLALSILSAERDASRHPSCPTPQSWSMDCGQLNRMSVLFVSALVFNPFLESIVANELGQPQMKKGAWPR